MSTSPSDPVSGVRPLAADYFDGRSTRPHAVTLTLGGGVLSVRGDSIQRDDPITVLRVSEPMGAAPRLISFSDGAHCEVRDHAGMAAMLESSGFRDGLVVRLQRHWRWAFAAVLVTVAAVVAGYKWGLPAASEWLAFRTPEAVLAKLGSGTMNVLDRAAFLPSKLPEARQQQLREKFDRMIAPGNTARPRHVLLFRDGGRVGANALAIPDGTIVITDQLAALTADDEEILSVLAHELGHIERRHGLRMLIQGSIVAFVVSWYIGDVSSVAAGLPTLLLQAQYSRVHELEADRYGAAMLKANGIAPRKLGDMLAKLEAAHRSGKEITDPDAKDKRPSEKDRKRGVMGDYLSSHPATRERIEALNKGGT